MGVHHLWQVVEPQGRRTTLSRLALQYLEVECVEDAPQVQKVMKIGVDVGTYMNECADAARGSGLSLQSMAGMFRPLFFRLCRLLQIPAHFVFVYDGRFRPQVKRGTKVQVNRPPYWVEPSKTLVRAFGFTVHQAPGEAEAELALLNRWGNVDAVYTADCDALVFGAPLVLRSLKAANRTASDEVELFSAAAIQSSLGLTWDRLVFYALAAGGDYDTGIEKCGRSYATEIARSGAGDSLIRGARALSEDTLEGLISAWRVGAEGKLQHTGLGEHTKSLLLGGVRRRLFPQKNSLSHYTHPVNSFTHSDFLPDTRSWSEVHSPSIAQIATFCRQSMGWTDEDMLAQTFKNNVLEGVILRLIYSDMCRWSQEDLTFGLSAHRLMLQLCLVSPDRDVNPMRVGVQTQEAYAVLVEDKHLVPKKLDGVFRVWAPEKVVPTWALQAASRSNGLGAGSKASDSRQGEKVSKTRPLASGRGATMVGRKRPLSAREDSAEPASGTHKCPKVGRSQKGKERATTWEGMGSDEFGRDLGLIELDDNGNVIFSSTRVPTGPLDADLIDLTLDEG